MGSQHKNDRPVTRDRSSLTVTGQSKPVTPHVTRDSQVSRVKRE